MGHGGALDTPAANHFQSQVPRLTTMLRTYTTDRGGHFDVDAEYIARSNKLRLKEKPKQASGSGIGSSKLARRLFSSWDTAPKPAKEAYEKFLQATVSLLGTELAGEDLYASAECAFEILEKAPLEDNKRLTIARQHAPFKEELKKAFGHIEDKMFSAALAASRKLVVATGNLQSSKPAGKRVEGGAASEEWGSGLAFVAWDPALHVSAPGTVDELELVDKPSANRKPARSQLARNTDSARSGTLLQGVKDLRWLSFVCAECASTRGGGFTGDELAEGVCRILLAGQDDQETAAELMELLGDDAFDLVSALLESRATLASSLTNRLQALRESHKRREKDPSGPMQQVFVRSETDIQTEKLQKKEHKRLARQAAGAGSHADFLNKVGFSALVQAEDNEAWEVEIQATEAANPTMSGGGWGSGDAAPIKSLPKGTKRTVHKGYEEVYVPPTPTAAPLEGERRVQISELEEWAQLAFEGTTALNRIQSRIFEAAYKSNENLLVCAPTGAGKTNIAMLTVLHEIGQHLKYGVLQKEEFKIVYVAPMKALAAEMTAAFGRRLAGLNMVVKELTGDMQLSKKELEETQMIVTTPEKWDVITRKGGEVSMAASVRLLVIDEVHLLNDDRGPVIETLVARTLRQVETSQSMIRIVGLSATLPNYQDVALFLGVNIDTGLFYFDQSYRPVPLTQTYLGVSEKSVVKRIAMMNEICYDKVADAVRKGNQAMVFVHSRKETGKTAHVLMETAQKMGEVERFSPAQHPQYGLISREAKKSRNRELTELFESGFGIHHAGMMRSDRNLTEKLFSEGILKVLVCTATLAWGVNLPAQTVVIKGTSVYDAQRGGFKDLGMLDVMQIFGRAGRPQFKQDGEAHIITTHDKLAHYLGMITHQIPIESQFVKFLPDNLNAELVLGSISTVKEACTWLGYTYLFVRMMRNPLAYGLTWQDLEHDPRLEAHRKKLVAEAARQLDHARTMRFDEKSGNLYPTEQGRVASHFYVAHKSMEEYNSLLKRHMNEADIFNMVAHSAEFENVVVRDEEMPELEVMARKCPINVKGGVENKIGKVNVLLQAFISRARVDSFSLTADLSYISQSAGRIFRALFELCLRRGWCSLADSLLQYCIAVERRLWPHTSPLRQFDNMLSPEILMKLEEKKMTLEYMYDMEAQEIGSMLRHPAAGKQVKSCLECFPNVKLEATVQPITRSVLRVRLLVEAAFKWRDVSHGNSLRWHIWVEDSDNEHIYHSEVMHLTKKASREGPQAVAFTIPIFEPLPPQYYIRCICDSWYSAEAMLTLSFHNLILPQKHPPHTELLDLDPLPLEALDHPDFISMYQGKFTHFNAIQTQAFHTLYHTDHNVLLGAPTGSGKTISSELAMMRAFKEYPEMKVIYIAPLKALVKERITDWRKGLCVKLKKRMVELTGDYTPDMRSLLGADLIVATPEKWDGISRNWQNRSYVKKVSLLVIDEIHLLGADRGPILEVIVSRMRYITTQTGVPVRFVGLSTALANARDIADWLGIDKVGLFNFRPSVRPVPLEVHIQGYPGKFYCPRMATMNKPTYAAITSHSPKKPVLVFVSSRRQTRLTALDLIAYAAADENPRQWLHIDETLLEDVLVGIKDQNLKHTLEFGIGMHHAGLCESDRTVVEELFCSEKIQILVCTSTLAWGVNFPAHLVVIKGTEFFDGATRRYVDFPITDVLQMMGRAGRPQFDNHGVAVILVHEPKKSFYKKFLYEPFPVESSLPDCLHDHFNAEVVAGTLTTKQDAVDYLTWTYFFRRLVQNPTYYNLESTNYEDVNGFLSGLVESTLFALEDAQCIAVNDDDSIEPLTLGRVAAYYYLQYSTAALFSENLNEDLDVEKLLHVLCASAEYDELPVRHNEDRLNAELATQVPWKVDVRTADDPHTKANLLLQAHFSRLPLPMSDYLTDTRSCLDNSVRIVQAMVDILADAGWLCTTLHVMNLMQMLMQARWIHEPSVLMLPQVTHEVAGKMESLGVRALPQLMSLSHKSPQRAEALMQQAGMSQRQAQDAGRVLARLPIVRVSCMVKEKSDEDATVEVEMRRENRLAKGTSGGGGSHNSAPNAYAPRFPKVKEEGWWLVLGDRETRELQALKRVSFSDHTIVKLHIPRDAIQGALTLYCMSDCYLGLDQQVEVTKSRPVPKYPQGNKDSQPVAPKFHFAAGEATDEDTDEEFWDDPENVQHPSSGPSVHKKDGSVVGARQADGPLVEEVSGGTKDEEWFWDMSGVLDAEDTQDAGSHSDDDFWDMSATAAPTTHARHAIVQPTVQDEKPEESSDEEFWDMS